MKKLLLTLYTVASLSSWSYGWEMPSNPDRYPSFAISYDAGSISGDGRVGAILPTTFGGAALGSTTTEDEIEIRSFSPSLRLPFAGNASLDIRATFYEQEQSVDGNGFELENDLSGTFYGATLRVYLIR